MLQAGQLALCSLALQAQNSLDSQASPSQVAPECRLAGRHSCLTKNCSVCAGVIGGSAPPNVRHVDPGHFLRTHRPTRSVCRVKVAQSLPNGFASLFSGAAGGGWRPGAGESGSLGTYGGPLAAAAAAPANPQPGDGGSAGESLADGHASFDQTPSTIWGYRTCQTAVSLDISEARSRWLRHSSMCLTCMCNKHGFRAGYFRLLVACCCDSTHGCSRCAIAKHALALHPLCHGIVLSNTPTVIQWQPAPGACITHEATNMIPDM